MFRKSFLCLVVLLSVFVLTTHSHALVISSDPFDATDRYALLFQSPDGTITQIQVKVKAPESGPLGTGQIWALMRYKLPPTEGSKTFYFSVSTPVSIQGLSQTLPIPVSFDLLGEPIPSHAYYRTLMIYYQADSLIEPLLVAEYTPDQLLLRPSGNAIQTQLSMQDTALSGERILGPLTVIRENGVPQTDSIPFSISDVTGQFFLRITNGTADGTHRVASAVIKLNGQEVLRPSELNQQVAEINRQINLKSGENTLDVRLRSIPGSHVTIEIYRLGGHTCRTFGPHTFIRATGKPVTENITFPLNPQMTGPFTMSLTNGDINGTYRVDSAHISLNSIEIFNPSQLNEQISSLSQTVSHNINNTLDVELQGAPGDRLTLEMTGFDNTLPAVTITNPTSGTTFSAGPITVKGVVDDPSASVTVNGIVATVASDGTFTVDGVSLQEGENTLTTIATDSCENQSQDVTQVYLQTIPVGPEITFCAEPFREQIPHPPGDTCYSQAYGTRYGFVTGIVDESAVSVSLNGVFMPDGVEIYDEDEEGPVFWGMLEGSFIWAFVNIPRVDGIHPFTLVANDAQGGRSEATVTFIRDTVPPRLAITSPPDWAVTNASAITITGTVDDPDAIVRLSWWYGPVIPVVNGLFTTQVNLGWWEGLNYITIIARDPAGNSTSATLRVIRDITPPQINLVSPAEGMIVNTPTLNLTGYFTEQNPQYVTVVINGGAPQALTLVGTSFSGIVALNPGQNTLLFEAKDKAGNASTVTRNVFLDLDQPIVTITSPASGAQLSGLATVIVDAADILSGIANVSLLVDGHPYASTSLFPYTFTLDTIIFATGAHTITARAADRAGNFADASINIEILPQMEVQITSPNNNATVNLSSVMVKGNVRHNVPEVGVTVNGVIAQVYGEEFTANHVPIIEGWNTITAKAINTDGNSVQATIQIYAQPSAQYINLSSSIESGLSPLEITIKVDTYLANPIASSSITYSGPSAPTITTINPAEYKSLMTTEGIYAYTITITDTQGNRYEDSIAISVLNRTEMDTLLKTKWEGMKTALINGDIEGALTYFVAGRKDKYRQIFTAMGDTVNPILATISQIEPYTIEDGVAQYDAIRI